MRITSKCNMSCKHCCYSCRPGKGKHADFATVIDMIAFARNHCETLSIGGGEPTLHPRFFDILRHCLNDFDYVWLATNGTRFKTMRRLSDIIDGNDFYNFKEDSYEPIYQEDKLGVALSTDYFHDLSKVNPWVYDTWKRRAAGSRGAYELRDVTNAHAGIAKTGRAKRTGVGISSHCVCSSIIIEPDGKLKLCGCDNSPIIGDIWSGYEAKWERVFSMTRFNDYGCINDWRNATKQGR